MTFLYFKENMDESWIWHKKLSHLNFRAMSNVVKNDIVRGLPKFNL